MECCWGPAFYAYSANYLIDIAAGIVVDVEATPAHKIDEINATKTMIERVETRFDLKPQRLIGDTNYGTAEILGWMVDEKQIEPHVSVWSKASPNDENRKKVEMLFAHLKRILKLDRLRLRGPNGAHDEFLLAATAQHLRRMAKWLCPVEPETANMTI